jgi:hypothetical protein
MQPYRLNGALVIDTSEVATDTIDYVATDPTGLTSISTRTVITEAAALPPAASSTPDAIASSTAQ